MTNPCHETAECQNTLGSYSCGCPAGYDPEPGTSGNDLETRVKAERTSYASKTTYYATTERPHDHHDDTNWINLHKKTNLHKKRPTTHMNLPTKDQAYVPQDLTNTRNILIFSEFPKFLNLWLSPIISTCHLLSPFPFFTIFYLFLLLPEPASAAHANLLSPGKNKSKQISGDGLTCRDINECRRGAKCGGGAVCQNTIGSYKCACRQGFRSKFKNTTHAQLYVGFPRAKEKFSWTTGKS